MESICIWKAVQQPLNPYCQVERAKAEEEAAEAEWAAAVAAQEAWEAAEAERRATIAAARAAAGLPPEEAPQVGDIEKSCVPMCALTGPHLPCLGATCTPGSTQPGVHEFGAPLSTEGPVTVGCD
jgi:hypothetical protein